MKKRFPQKLKLLAATLAYCSPPYCSLTAQLEPGDLVLLSGSPSVDLRLAGSLVNHPHHRAQYLPWGTAGMSKVCAGHVNRDVQLSSGTSLSADGCRNWHIDVHRETTATPSLSRNTFSTNCLPIVLGI